MRDVDERGRELALRYRVEVATLRPRVAALPDPEDQSDEEILRAAGLPPSDLSDIGGDRTWRPCAC